MKHTSTFTCHCGFKTEIVGVEQGDLTLKQSILFHNRVCKVKTSNEPLTLTLEPIQNGRVPFYTKYLKI